MMSVTELIKRKRFSPGKGVTEPPPEKGVRLFFFVLHTHFWELVKLNLLFLAFCIPIVTIPAALCAVNRVIINLIEKGNSFLWSDFFTEFKGSIFKSLPFGVLYVFLIFDSFLATSMSITENGVNIPIATLAFFLFGSAIVFFSYVFVFIPALPLKNRHIAKNALIIMLVEWKTSTIIFASTVAMIIALLTIATYSIMIALLPLVFIYFSFIQLIICTAVNQSMKKRILDPYEEREA